MALMPIGLAQAEKPIEPSGGRPATPAELGFTGSTAEIKREAAELADPGTWGRPDPAEIAPVKEAAARVPQPVLNPFEMASISKKMNEVLNEDPSEIQRRHAARQATRFTPEFELGANEDPYLLPPGGLAPRCRTSGQRIRLIYAYPRGYQPTESWEALKPWESIARANLKFIFESSISSEGERYVDLNVECYPPGHQFAGYPTIRTIEIGPKDPANPHTLSSVITEVDSALQRSEGTRYRVRNLIFYAEDAPDYAGLARTEGATNDASLMTRNQYAANFWNYKPLAAAVARSSWIDNAVVHELLHTFGAVGPGHPLSTDLGHCLVRYDVMCYKDKGPRAHLFPLISPAECTQDQMYGIRIDCVEALYFRADHGDGTILDPWLEQKWNSIGAENRFVNAYPAWDYTVPCSSC